LDFSPNPTPVSQTPSNTLPLDEPALAGRGVAVDASGPIETALARRPLALAMVMLFVSALPDAMVVPLLNELFVQRYGVSVAAAHWFMSVNILGAVGAIPLLVIMRRRLAPATVLLLAAFANALWLAAMYLPIGFAATIGVRFLEGAADLIVFAVLFDLLAKAGPGGTRGRRLGLAGTTLMLGLFGGAVIGGRVGLGDAHNVFLIGAMAMLIVAIAAAGGATLFNRLVRSCPVVSDAGEVIIQRRPLWPPLVMVFSDRAIAGLMTATLPIYFASIAGQSTTARGWLIGLPLLLMAIGAWPMGHLGDRIGHLKLRTLAALLYAGAIACVPMASNAGLASTLIVMALIGLAGAGLLPTALALTTASGRGSAAMGGYRAAGDIGYLLGIALAGTLLALIGGNAPDAAAFTTVILTFAAVHFAMTVVAAFAARER
jgi:hypothetical protein